MTNLIKHASLGVFLALGACSQTAQTGTSLFYGNAGTEAAFVAAGAASNFDPTGVSSFALAHASSMAIDAHFRKQNELAQQQMRESDEELLRIRDNLRRSKRAAQRGKQTAPAETSNKASR